MKDKILNLTNKMVRVRRVINGYDQSMVGIITSTEDDTFTFSLNDDIKETRCWSYGDIKNVIDLTDNL